MATNFLFCRRPDGILLDSGHGGQTKDLDGDEEDGYDEGVYLPECCPLSIYQDTLVIYPVDFKENGHIVDDVRISVDPLYLPCSDHFLSRNYMK